MEHYKLQCCTSPSRIRNLFAFGLKLSDILCPTCFQDYQLIKETGYDLQLFKIEREIQHRLKKEKKSKGKDQLPALNNEQQDPIPAHKSTYELTLTTTKDDPYELRQWLKKIVSSRMFNVVKWKACFELTEAGLPHIHAILYSDNKYCDSSKIKSLKYPYRYEMKPVRQLEAYNNYILKEKDNPIVQEYCLKKGITQIFDA